jgi:hypothetical protein
MTEVNHAEIKSPVRCQDGAARWEQIGKGSTPPQRVENAEKTYGSMP